MYSELATYLGLELEHANPGLVLTNVKAIDDVNDKLLHLGKVGTLDGTRCIQHKHQISIGSVTPWSKGNTQFTCIL